MKLSGENSSFAYRKKIAELNGITGYLGTAKQNIKLLNLLKTRQAHETLKMDIMLIHYLS